MTKAGRLTISNEESRLDATLLARKGAEDSFGAATSFLRDLGLRDSNCDRPDSGLSSNYLGKPFGTVQDYFTLFVWAAGTKVGLDIVTAALDKLVAWAPASKPV